jgi:hypothetical protein
LGVEVLWDWGVAAEAGELPCWSARLSTSLLWPLIWAGGERSLSPLILARKWMARKILGRSS